MSETADLDASLAREFARFPQIAAAYLFGSVARGQARADSDADIGLVLRRRDGTVREHYWMIADLASRLEACFGGRRVDVVLLEPQGPVFAHRAIRDGRCVYDADPERRIDFETEVTVRAFDERPRRDAADRVYLAALKERLAEPRP